jgi:hypothetical protein
MIIYLFIFSTLIDWLIFLQIAGENNTSAANNWSNNGLSMRHFEIDSQLQNSDLRMLNYDF